MQFSRLKLQLRGTWVAQSGKRLTLDFGSGHDPTAHKIKPHVGLCADSAEPAWDSFSPSLPCPPTPQNKYINVKKSCSCWLNRPNLNEPGYGPGGQILEDT